MVMVAVVMATVAAANDAGETVGVESVVVAAAGTKSCFYSNVVWKDGVDF